MTNSTADEPEIAGRRWAEALEAWAIPEEILRAAPERPWGCPPELFSASARAALADTDLTPSRKRALEALGDAGSVLDVGAGSGAASLPLSPPATHVTAVDESEKMLEAFTDLARARSVAHETALGRWPDVAPMVGPADLVICHHVIYNVADIVSFVDALNRHATRRVVIELTATHPQSDLNLLWRELHGVERPEVPTAGDVRQVIEAMGFEVRQERFRRPSLWAHVERARRVEFARRRLCVGPQHDKEIERLLPESEVRELVTLWWGRV